MWNKKYESEISVKNLRTNSENKKCVKNETKKMWFYNLGVKKKVKKKMPV